LNTVSSSESLTKICEVFIKSLNDSIGNAVTAQQDLVDKYKELHGHVGDLVKLAAQYIQDAQARASSGEATAEKIIGQLIANSEFEAEQFAHHIANIELLVKSIVLVNGGSVLVPKDIMEMLTKTPYDLITTEVPEGLKLTIEEHVCQEEEGEMD